MRIRLLLLSLSLTCVLHAQTYTPKTLRVDGVPATDRQAVLDTAGFKPGVPLTKQQIEAGLGKLADTGSYSDLGYTVDGNALTIKLTVAADHRAMPVHYANFVWWTDAELERMVEARVPLFHGEMQPEGSLADQVRAALVAIAAEKGLTIEVGTTKRGGKLALSIDKPLITSGDLHVAEVKPMIGGTFAELKQGLHTLEFDEEFTAGSIEQDTADIYRNAGYLHVAVDPPVFAAPRAEGTKYVIDASVTVHPNDIFHVGSVTLHTPGVTDQAILTHADSIHSGETFSPMLANLAADSIKGGYWGLGYLDANVATTQKEDEAAHTVNFTFDATPGEIYYLARISVEGSLPSDLGTSLQNDPRLKAGVVAGFNVRLAATEVLKKHDALPTMRMNLEPNRADHTASLVIEPIGHRSTPAQ